jgi:hypothetical protein
MYRVGLSRIEGKRRMMAMSRLNNYSEESEDGVKALVRHSLSENSARILIWRTLRIPKDDVMMN